MKPTVVRIGYLLLGLASSSPAISGAVSPGTPRRAAVRASQPNPISTLVSALSLNTVRGNEDRFAACRRSNFKFLAIALDGVKGRLSTPKGEFETAADFNARADLIQSTLNSGGTLIICQPLNDNDDAPFKYDADSETFSGSFQSKQNVWRDVRRIGNYQSRTRMGIRATVKSSLDFEYNVDMSAHLPSVGKGCVNANYGTNSFVANVSRAQAPHVKGLGYLVFEGHLITPFIQREDSPGSPTLDDPRDVFERALTVSFSPERVSIVMPAGSEIWSCKL